MGERAWLGWGGEGEAVLLGLWILTFFNKKLKKEKFKIIEYKQDTLIQEGKRISKALHFASLNYATFHSDMPM